MLTGTYEHSLDPKGRLFIPAKLREELGTEIVLTRSPDKCINIYSKADWEALAQKILDRPMSENIKTRRNFFKMATITSADSQGRVLIPTNLREHANLEKDAIIIGVGDSLEIWDAKTLNDSDDDFDMIQALKEMGI